MIRELLSKTLYSAGSVGLLAGALMFSHPLWGPTFKDMPDDVYRSFQLQRELNHHQDYLDTVLITNSDTDDDISDQLDSYYCLKEEYDVLLSDQEVVDYREKMLTDLIVSGLGLPAMMGASIPFFLGLVITPPYRRKK